MSLVELGVKIDDLRYMLDNVDVILRGLSKDYFEKGKYISVLRLNTVDMRVCDLIEALNYLSTTEKSIMWDGVKL